MHKREQRTKKLFVDFSRRILTYMENYEFFLMIFHKFQSFSSDKTSR